MPERPAAVGLLGGGVIGGGWAARFVLNGVDVRLYDPAPDLRRLADTLTAARRAYRRLTLTPLPEEGELVLVESVAAAVAGVDFIQESAPERVELKQELLAAASRAAPAEVVIGSSTSGLRPSLLQVSVEHPERLVVGHPFNPVYLLPLVEVCGGALTAPETLERAATVYRSVGMHPLRVRSEIDGFLADRLLEALWREALWLIHDEVATVEELDAAISYGPGLRWAIMGTFLTYRLAGGEAGMRHFMAQFGPTLQAPWTKLVDVPELTPELVEKVVAQSDAQAGTRSLGDLERMRDDCLVALLHALRAQEVGAGRTVADWERGLRDGADDGDGTPGSDGAAPAAPLSLLAREVPPEWTDDNRRVHKSHYLQLFGDATDALLRLVGIDARYVESVGSYDTVETHLSHLRELHAGDRVRVHTQLLGADEVRLHVFHVLLGDPGSDPLAMAEHMLVHVDGSTGRARAAGDSVAERVRALADAHAALPWPERAGRRIALA